MSFGLTPDGFKIKRLDDILTEKRQRYKDKFGDNFDVSDSTPEGQIIAIEAEREAKLWELAQAVYNSQYRHSAEGAQLDNAVALTGNSRKDESFSRVTSGVAYGENGTPVPKDTIISVQGNSTARFITLAAAVINIADGDTFKSAPITLQAIDAGPVQANAGTLTVIETPVVGMDSFTNTLDAELGANVEQDPDLKQRVDGELQVAGAATIEAIVSELKARPLVTAVKVFQNIYSVEDADGRPPKSLDIVVQGDEQADVAEAIFKVVGGGIETIGDITETVIDSQGFEQTVKFSRPTEVPIWIVLDLVTDPELFPDDGADQIEALMLAYGLTQTVGQKVVVFGSNDLAGCFRSVPGVTDFEIKVGKVDPPTTDDNVAIAARELAKFDSSRITINVT